MRFSAGHSMDEKMPAKGALICCGPISHGGSPHPPPLRSAAPRPGIAADLTRLAPHDFLLRAAPFRMPRVLFDGIVPHSSDGEFYVYFADATYFRS
jgi:hypothetical protein